MQRIAWWWYRLRRASLVIWAFGDPDISVKCDWCAHEAPTRELTPCSCDLWLCDACLRRYMKGE